MRIMVSRGIYNTSTYSIRAGINRIIPVYNGMAALYRFFYRAVRTTRGSTAPKEYSQVISFTVSLSKGAGKNKNCIFSWTFR